MEFAELDPSIVVELRYAGSRNLVGRPFYPANAKALLRPDAAEALKRVAERLEPLGFKLKVWDAYRPKSAHLILWNAFPNAQYVAQPEEGSKHSRGCAVDVTLADPKTGRELEMPGDHDEFGDHTTTLSDIPTPDAKRHRDILRLAMTAEGWNAVSLEWWHYNWKNWEKWPISDAPLTGA